MIASDAGGLSEAIVDDVNGLLFPSGDSEALADRIIRYFTNRLGPVFSETLRSSALSRTTAVDIIEELAASTSPESKTANVRAGA